MKMIVCISQNYGIGKNGTLLFSIPQDMKMFRSVTLNKIVIMGKNTLLSFPGSKPLKNRTNIVLTHDKNFFCEGCIVLHSKEEVDEYVSKYNTDDVYIIGGAQIYSLFEQDADTALVTKVYEEANADTFFMNIDDSSDWILNEESPMMEDNGHNFKFCKYIRS